MVLEHINPSTMHHNPAFSQGVLQVGPGRLLVVGGQNGVDAAGAVVSDDFAEQSKQAMRNVLTVLEAAGARQEDVAKLTVYLAAGQDAAAGYEAITDVWGRVPTAVTVVQVASFARPGILVEIDALAVIPEA